MIDKGTLQMEVVSTFGFEEIKGQANSDYWPDDCQILDRRESPSSFFHCLVHKAGFSGNFNDTVSLE